MIYCRNQFGIAQLCRFSRTYYYLVMFFSKLTLTSQQFKKMKEKCAEQPTPSYPPHPVCAGKSVRAAPMGMVVLGPLAIRLWVFCMRKLVWVFILLLCSQTPKLLTFQLSTAVQTWLSVIFHFTDLIGFHWYSKSNKCMVSKILQILLLFSSAHTQPAVSDGQRKMARKQLGSWVCPDLHCLSLPLKAEY